MSKLYAAMFKGKTVSTAFWAAVNSIDEAFTSSLDKAGLDKALSEYKKLCLQERERLVG